MPYFPTTSMRLRLVTERFIPRYACLRARLGLAVVGRTDQVSEDIRRALSVLAQLDEKEEHDQRI